MIDQKSLLIVILVLTGIVFATLLTCLVYKIWKHLNIKNNADTKSTLDNLASNIFFPYNVPLSTYPVAAQEPVEPVKPNVKDQIQKELSELSFYYEKSKENDKRTRKTRIIQNDGDLLRLMSNTPKDPNIKIRELKKTRDINLRGCSLTEEMFYDSINNTKELPFLPQHRSSSTESLLDDDENGVVSKKAGKIRFKTRYFEKEKTLRVLVVKAFDIAPDREMDEIRPFARLSLYPGKKQGQNTDVKKEATKEPFFNEVIIFQGLTLHDICTHKLKLKICNNVRVRKKEILGEAELNLSSIDQYNEKEFTIELYQIKKEVSSASISVTLNHESVNEHLSVVIHEASVPKVGRSFFNINPFVTLEFFKDEMLVNKKQTTTKRKTMQPFFNEYFHFPLKLDDSAELKQYSLLLTVKYYSVTGKCKNFGFLSLSSTSSSDSAKEQWEKVMAVADAPHKAYHSLLLSNEM